MRYILSVLVLIAIYACQPNRKPTEGNTPAPPVHKTLGRIDSIPIDTPVILPIRNFGVDGNDSSYVVFGRFCGHCRGNCAVMYKINLAGNKLMADYTDSYWKRENIPMTFNSRIKEPDKILWAKKIMENIPGKLWRSRQAEQTFGCPDCADGCGIYLQICKNKHLKTFYIDAQTHNITGDVKRFADFFNNSLSR